MASILNSLFAGRSGLASHGLALGVIGDNIANVNTIGHKASRAEFSDLLAGRAGAVTVGVGSEVGSTTIIQEQGTIELTGRDLDVAIDGNGFFVVQDNAGAKFYTRAGNFKASTEGYLVTQGGLRVLGYPDGGSGALQPLDLSAVAQDNISTQNLGITGNLDARAASIGGAGAIPAVDVAGVGTASTTTYADLNAAAEYSTSVDVFDTLGGSHTVTVFFFRTGASEYTARAYVNSEDVDAAGTATGLPRLLTNGTTGDITMTFAGDGTRSNAPAAGAPDLALNVPWNNGSDPAAKLNVDFSAFTQFSSASSMTEITQDGQGVGNLTNISIAADGTVSTILDNGQEAVIGSIALANFANPEALIRSGGQLLQKSTESGEPVLGSPNTGTFGMLASESIEMSTVDVADQFVKLITLQRGFQANSKIITTVNQLLAELMQLA